LKCGNVNNNSINKQKIVIFVNTWNAVKIGKIKMDKRIRIDFTKSPPDASKDHSSSSKLNYYHQLTNYSNLNPLDGKSLKSLN